MIEGEQSAGSVVVKWCGSEEEMTLSVVVWRLNQKSECGVQRGRRRARTTTQTTTGENGDGIAEVRRRDVLCEGDQTCSWQIST
jgi:hypothetical protein